MRVRLQIQGAIVGDGITLGNNNRAKFGDIFPNYYWVEETGLDNLTPRPDPNVYTIRAELEDDVAVQVEASAKFWVNWAEDLSGLPFLAGVPSSLEEPSQARHDAMSQWMLGMGNTQAFIDSTLGVTPAGRSAAVIGETVYVNQRTLPPGVIPPPWALNIKITREPGWQSTLGWRAVLLDWESTVAPASTAITTWTEPDASGTSIVHGPFNWDADAQEWYVVCSPGFETGNAPVFFSVLYGSAVWAAWTMPYPMDEMTYVVNGDPAEAATQTGASWQDSGATVTGIAGAATTVSDTTPFSIGTLTRINGIEQEVNNIGAGWINLVPYQNPPHANGSIIEIWA